MTNEPKPKQAHITIHRTNNGYLVMPDSYHSDRVCVGDDQTWTFESMAALQKRLPEILEQPIEKKNAAPKKGRRRGTR